MRHLLIVVAAAVAGCGGRPDVARILVTADTLTMYSIDGRRDPDPTPEPGVEKLHGYRVFGKVRLDADDRRAVAAAVRAAVADPTARVAACFWPRHAVRAELPAGPVDVLVCFPCGGYEVRGLGPTGGSRPFGVQGKPLFNDLLTRAGVPLCPEDLKVE